MKFLFRVVIPMLIAGAAIGAPTPAPAPEFKNIDTGPTIMYDAPSSRGQKLYIAPRGMPVEVVMKYGLWSRVRDTAGDMAWVETKLLGERKNIVVRSLSAKIRKTPDDNGELVFSADKGVLLEVVDTTTAGWVRVKHADGSTGFVKAGDVWGL